MSAIFEYQLEVTPRAEDLSLRCEHRGAQSRNVSQGEEGPDQLRVHGV
jgi:hypothetical protein